MQSKYFKHGTRGEAAGVGGAGPIRALFVRQTGSSSEDAQLRAHMGVSCEVARV
jgi:hypothetical protein